MYWTVNEHDSEHKDTATRSGVNRRTMLFGGASALAVRALFHAGLTEAHAQESSATPVTGDDETSGLEALRDRLDEYGFLWTATSPGTHQGDTYTLTATNPGTTNVKLLTFTVLMDHRQHHHEVLVNEEVELAPGQSHEFTATNDYGTANHFSTRIVSTAADTASLTLAVIVTTADGTESASFNERAFTIDNRDDLQQLRESRRAERRDARRNRRRHLGHEGMGGGSENETPETEATPDI
jgi:hypothetical protein